jgi:hypothetical protein
MPLKNKSVLSSLSLFPWILVVILVTVIFCLFASQKKLPSSPLTPPALTEKREFMFQIDKYVTKNQGGQTLNMYFHYRYNTGIATQDIPDYRDLRNAVITYLDHLDTSQNPYWETLSKTICDNLKQKFPIEAISCQLQVASDTRSGLPNEPGVHSSITTIGDIDSLTITK